MNKANYALVLDKIKIFPEQWDQHVWHCDTKHCFAGWAQILSGAEEDRFTAARDAKVFLKISHNEARYLFDADRKLPDLVDFLENGMPS